LTIALSINACLTAVWNLSLAAIIGALNQLKKGGECFNWLKIVNRDRASKKIATIAQSNPNPH